MYQNIIRNLSQYSSQTVMTSLPALAVWEDAKRNNGKILVCPDGFKFNIGKKGEKKTFLHCIKKKDGCRVTATVDKIADMLIDIR